MKLDTTKVYYLGDLSDEQLQYFNKMFGKKIDLERTSLISFIDNNWHLTFATTRAKTNALTLFKNERIAQIQLRIQELNNELIELDEEMRTLTYGK